MEKFTVEKVTCGEIIHLFYKNIFYSGEILCGEIIHLVFIFLLLKNSLWRKNCGEILCGENLCGEFILRHLQYFLIIFR